MPRCHHYAALAATLALLAVAGPAAAQGRPTAESPFEAATMAARVPDNAVAYVRLPTPMAYLTAPKSTLFEQTQRDAAIVAAIEQINAGIEKTLADFPAIDLPPVRLLLTVPRSPIEILIAPAPGSEMPTPLAFVTMATSFEEAEDAQGFVESLITSLEVPATFEGDIDDDGLGITGLPMPARAAFDEATGQLSLLIGPGATPNRLTAYLALLDAPAGEPPMAAMESRVDASRFEFFSWLDVEQALSIGAAFIPPNVTEMLTDLGLANADDVGLGLGSANGKARLLFATSIPSTDGYRALIPVIDNDIDFRTTGAPDLMLAIGLPTRAEIDAIVAAIAEEAEDGQEIYEILEMAEEYVGFDPLIIFDAFEHTAIVMEDVGYYYATKFRDRRAYDRAMKAISEHFEAPIERRRIDGRDYYGIQIPPIPELAGPGDDEDDISDEALQALQALYLRIRTPVYWTFDGEYLYSADMPQVLVDRFARGAAFGTGDWLRESQRHDTSESVLAFSSNVERLPRLLHQVYLTLLTTLSDVVGADIDPWSLPSADQIGLPESGTLAGSINLGDPVLSGELIFENTLFDGVTGGSLESIVVLGILAGIAVPAYQDYTLRAEVSQGIALAAGAKTGVAEYYFENGRFPPALEANEMSFEQPTEGISYIFVQPDSGTIEIQFGGPGASSSVDGGTVWLTPEVDETETIVWVCESSIEDAYLPSTCRY